MAINIFHRCLVRSQPLAGASRFLAGLFTFLSRQPIANQLRACVRNWFRTIITTTPKSDFVCVLHFAILCWAVKWGWSCMQLNGRKLVMQPETDEGNELRQETSNVAGNWWRQWTTTVLPYTFMGNVLIWVKPPSLHSLITHPCNTSSA